VLTPRAAICPQVKSHLLKSRRPIKEYEAIDKQRNKYNKITTSLKNRRIMMSAVMTKMHKYPKLTLINHLNPNPRSIKIN